MIGATNDPKRIVRDSLRKKICPLIFEQLAKEILELGDRHAGDFMDDTDVAAGDFRQLHAAEMALAIPDAIEDRQREVNFSGSFNLGGGGRGGSRRTRLHAFCAKSGWEAVL